MDAIYESTTLKAITFVLATSLFLLTPLINKAINRRLHGAMKAQHAKLAKDAWVKTIMLYAGSVVAGLVAFINGGFDKAISQAFFGMCLFSSLSSFWTIRKTKLLIQEAKALSVAGNRAARIHNVEIVNRMKAMASTFISFTVGLLGFLYVAFVFDKYSFSWVWLTGFVSTLFAVQSARWSDAASFAIAKYASDPRHGQ